MRLCSRLIHLPLISLWCRFYQLWISIDSYWLQKQQVRASSSELQHPKQYFLILLLLVSFKPFYKSTAWLLHSYIAFWTSHSDAIEVVIQGILTVLGSYQRRNCRKPTMNGFSRYGDWWWDLWQRAWKVMVKWRLMLCVLWTLWSWFCTVASNSSKRS